jgi:hypothetical protein
LTRRTREHFSLRHVMIDDAKAPSKKQAGRQCEIWLTRHCYGGDRQMLLRRDNLGVSKRTLIFAGDGM